MRFLWNFRAVTICVLLALINNSYAGRFGGGRSGSRGSSGRPSYSRQSYSRPSPSHSYSHPSPSYSHPSPSYSHPSLSYSHPSPSYSHPSPSYSHPSPSYSHPSPSYSHPSPSYSHPSPSYSHPSPSYSHPSSSYPASPPSYHSAVNSKSYSPAPPSYSKGPSYSGSSHPPAPPAYSKASNGYSPKVPSAPIAPPAYNPSIGWKVTPKNTGTGNDAHKLTYSSTQNSGYGRPGPKPVGPVGPATAPAGSISPSKSSQLYSSNPAHSGGLNPGLNYPRQEYIKQNQNYPYSYPSQGHVVSPPPHQPTVVQNFVTHNHHSNYHTPSYSPVPYHFVSYHHYPSYYYSPFHDYSPISLHIHSGSHYGYGGHHDHYIHHYPSSSSANSNTPSGDINTNPSNSGQHNNAGGSNQNGTIHKSDPFERSQPLIYTIPAQKTSDDDADSTEIIFTNPYLIVGVENLLFYGEFHDDEDTMIFIDQGSDGLEPLNSLRQPNYNADTNLTSSTTFANNGTIILERTTLAPSTETTTDYQKPEITTTVPPNNQNLFVHTTSQPISFD